MNLFADVIGPGEIRDGGSGALVVGELDGRDSRRVREVVDDLQAWGPARATGNVSGYLWSKLGFGAMLVATALADAPMAELIDRHRPVMHALVAEVYAVAAAEGVALEPFDAFDPLPYAGDDDAAKERGHRRARRLAAHAGQGPQRHLARHRGPAQAHRGPHPLPPGARRRRAARHPGARPGAAGRPDRRAGVRCGDGRGPHRRPGRSAAVTAVPPPSAVDGVDVAALHRWLDARRRQLVDDLVAYAELETPSDDLALLEKGLAHVEEWLAERLGAAREPGAPRVRRARRRRGARVRRYR